MVAATNANGTITTYNYCECGLLDSMTNGWNTAAAFVTAYGYDYQGHRQYLILPDATITNWYDAVGRVITTCDAWGCVGYEYDNQGLLTNTYDSFGSRRAVYYDIHDRPEYVTDPNQVTVANTYDLLDRLTSRTYPDGGVESFGYTARGLTAYTNQLNYTNFYYYDAGRRQTSEFDADGQTLLFTNNPAGDLLSVTDGKNQTTVWKYDPYGQVTNQLDQLGAVVLKYQYDPDRRLTNRWSAAMGNTGYGYDAAGNLTNLAPVIHPVSFRYDPLNRLTSMVDAVGTNVYTYASGGELATEDGPFANDTVTNVYWNRLRIGLGLQQPAGFWTNAFGYDDAKRLTGVASPAGIFSYIYDPWRSGLVDQLSLPNGSLITNRYDGNARLLGTWLKTSGGTVLDAATYGYNLAGERTTSTNATATNVAYLYDPLGQLKAATSSTTAENRGYLYDAAWNLSKLTNNGATSPFNVDGDNQLTSIAGTAYGYDGNGNLTTQTTATGQITTYTYDDENRLTGVVNYAGTSQTTFVYDGLGRLREQLQWTNTSGGGGGDVVVGGVHPNTGGGTGWTQVGGLEYIYDGSRVIQERNTGNTPTASYTRGNDLSGTLQGAGGIGGLLARSGNYSGGNFANHNYYHADGIGNLTYLETAAQGLAASYRYDPYGNLLLSSGTLATTNSYRFSSKEFVNVPNGGLYYYLYRFYSPPWQRWLNRDPIGEAGGLNLYEFADNDAIDSLDPFGLAVYPDDFVGPLPSGSTRDSEEADLRDEAEGTGAQDLSADAAVLAASASGEQGLKMFVQCLAKTPKSPFQRMGNAGKAIDKGDLTKAGRALQKHGSRPGSVFPQATGNSKAINQQGQQVLEDILSTENQVINPNRFGGRDIFDVNTGRGARFDENGNLKGFLEP